jgi:hypothetical protein
VRFRLAAQALKSNLYFLTLLGLTICTPEEPKPGQTCSQLDPNCDGIVEVDVVLVNRLELEHFGSQNIHSITGSLIIGENWDVDNIITSLAPLSELKSIGRDLVIKRNPSLKNLQGLENLTSVGNSILIRYNDSLLSLDGIENIKSNGIAMYLIDNPQLKDISAFAFLTNPKNLLIKGEPELDSLHGLENVVTVENDLELDANAKLINVDPLTNLTSVKGRVLITSNIKLNNLRGLKNVVHVGGDITISGNDDLLTFEAFNGLETVEGDLIIAGNRNLMSMELSVREVKGLLQVGAVDLSFTNLLSVGGNITLYASRYRGFHQLKVVRGDLEIRGTSVEPALGFITLQKVEGGLKLKSSTGDLADFANLQHVDGDLSVSYCTGATVDGLAALTHIAGDVQIEHNSKLEHIDGLNAVAFIGGDLVKIHSNPLLKSHCGIMSVFQNGGTQAQFLTFANSFNPILEELLVGDCKR